MTGQLDWPVLCPSCGAKNDGYTQVAAFLEQVFGPGNVAGPPKPGDVSLCGYCTRLAVYEDAGGQLTLRAATDDETDQALRDPLVAAAMQAAQQVRLRRKAREN